MNLQYLKNFDCLSPNITLFYDKKKSHTCIFSGFLSIIHYIIFTCIVIYYFYVMIFHKSPTMSYFKKSIEESEFLELTKENFNHSITLNSKNAIDEKVTTIIGVQTDDEFFFLDINKKDYDYWLYRRCDEEYRNNSFCINQFYNHTLKRFFHINDGGFSYPLLSRKIEDKHPDSYNVFVTECYDTSINDYCSSKEALDLLSISITFTDSYINTEIYKEPFIKFNRTIDLNVMKNVIVSSSIQLYPTKLRTHEKFIFNYITEIKEFVFDKFSYNTYEKGINNVITSIRFLIYNQEKVYERQYFGLNEALISIVSLAKASWYFFFSINFFFNKYITYHHFGDYYQKNYYKFIKLNSSQSNQSDTLKSQGLGLGKQNSKLSRNKNCIEFYSFYKESNYTLNKLILHYLKCKSSSFVRTLIRIRCNALSEEKLIKYHLMFSNVDSNCSFFLDSTGKGTIKSIPQSFGESDKKAKVIKGDLNNSNNDLLKKQNFVKDSSLKIRED